MGHTLVSLSKRDLPSESIFSNRFVIECAEKMHLHYRNMRILLNVDDFKKIGSSCYNAMSRWKNLGNPENNANTHIELCRQSIAEFAHNDGIRINLNKNLYNLNDGKIFAEGCDFKDEKYIHLKIRDIRLEMSIEEFKTLAGAVKEAEGKLNEVT